MIATSKPSPRSSLTELIKYWRVTLFFRWLPRFSRWARSRRMLQFIQALQIRGGVSIIDLGGQPEIWQSVPSKLDLTIVNLPGAVRDGAASIHSIHYLEGDACHLTHLRDRSFDVVFSNSVIEHVGDAAKRSAFAAEVKRLGKSYWVQTPARWFPLEPHCGMPFWWFYPRPLRNYFIGRWRQTVPYMAELIEGTVVLSKAELRGLFPGATIKTERVLGVPKSYVAFHR